MVYLVSGSVSVQTDLVPRYSGFDCFSQPLKGNSETALTIVCRIDLNDSDEDGRGRFFPIWLYVKTIGVTGAKSFTDFITAYLPQLIAHIFVIFRVQT